MEAYGKYVYSPIYPYDSETLTWVWEYKQVHDWWKEFLFFFFFLKGDQWKDFDWKNITKTRIEGRIFNWNQSCTYKVDELDSHWLAMQTIPLLSSYIAWNADN